MENQKDNHDDQKGDDPIRIERNADTLPIWAPSRYAKTLEREYALEWISPNAKVLVQSAGKYGTLRWQDKLVLIAITRLWYEQGMNPDGWVNFTLSDVTKRLGKEKGGSRFGLIKYSLWRLRGCLVQFHHSFYNSNDKTKKPKTLDRHASTLI